MDCSLHSILFCFRSQVTRSLNTQLCILFSKTNTCIFFTLLGPNPLPTLLGPHSHTPADTRPPRGEAAAGPALRSPWSARIYPAWDPNQSHKEVRKGKGTGSLSSSPAAHRRRLQLHEPFFRSPFGGHQTAPGEEREGSASVYPRSLPGPSAPPVPASPPSRSAPLTGAPRAPPPAAARAPHGTGAAARPGPPSRRGESPWGHASAGAASGTASGRRGVHGRCGRRRRGVRVTRYGPPDPVPDSHPLPRAHPMVPVTAGDRSAPHLSTRPAGTSTATGSDSGSIGPPPAPARAPPRPAHLRTSVRP